MQSGFPLKFYFRGHKIPLTLILEGIWGDFGGQLYITFNRKISTCRGQYVSLESKFRGHLKQKWAKCCFFEGQGKPCAIIIVKVFAP